MVGVTKLRIKFGPEGSVKTFQVFPGIKKCSNANQTEETIGEDVVKASNQSRKRRPKELEDVPAKKKQKLDRVLSSQCFTLLRSLMEHYRGWLFSEPVDPVKLDIPDYFSIISKPMDLGTIKSKLLKNVYSNGDEFAGDVRLTFNNAMLYNPPDNLIHKVAKELKDFFEVRWESLQKKKISELSGSVVKDGSKEKPFEVDCLGRFSVEPPKPVKEKAEKVSLLSKPVKGQSNKDTLVVTPKALATKSQLRTKKLDQGPGICSTVKSPSKGSNPTATCKCGSCGSITCLCLKSSNSCGSDVSSLTDCQVENTSGSQASESDPHSNELKTLLPAMVPLPPDKALRAALLKCQYAETILRAKHRKVLAQQSNKADLIRIQKEKEEMERTQRQETARIEAEMKAAEIAARMKTKAELRKQQRDRARIRLEEVKIDYDFQENNFRALEKDIVSLCGGSDLTRSRLFKELGLVLRDDDSMEDIESETYDAITVEDLEEGEIL